jgi:hypothetical protein
MAALRLDALPDGLPLYDTGFAVIPPLFHLTWVTTTYYATIADVWCMATYVLFAVLIVPFCCKTPWTTKTRFTFCLSFVFAVRTLVLLCTRYPQIAGGKNVPYLTPNTALGAVLVVLGVRTTQTDYLFSGHSCGWILTALFFWHYKRDHLGFALFAILFWLSNTVGIILLIGVRTHYTSDVVVAIFLSVLTFTVYHLAVSPRETYAYRFLKWVDSGPTPTK